MKNILIKIETEVEKIKSEAKLLEDITLDEGTRNILTDEMVDYYEILKEDGDLLLTFIKKGLLDKDKLNETVEVLENINETMRILFFSI